MRPFLIENHHNRSQYIWWNCGHISWSWYCLLLSHDNKHVFRVQSQTNEEVTYQIVEAYFCKGSSTWTEQIKNPVIRYSMSAVRQIFCEVGFDAEDFIENVSGAVESLTSEQRTDFYNCIENHVHYVWQQIFCVPDALDNYESLIYYSLYMVKCSSQDTKICNVFLFLLKEREPIIDLVQRWKCPRKSNRKTRQYSIVNTLQTFKKIACDIQDGWLQKFLDMANNSGNYDHADIYRPHVKWDFINHVVPPFFCCSARAAYEGSHWV